MKQNKNNKVYFIAELNTSHFGDLNIAKKMINAAKLAGCNCVKLQSWTAKSLYSEDFYKKKPIAKKFFEKYSLDNKNIKILADYARKIKIDFSSTPYSREEVDFLVKECNPAFIKIASMDLNNYEFLKYAGKKGKPIILSTGMSDENEIKQAVKTLKKTGNNKITLLHCISLYPTPSHLVNLKNILGLKEIFPNINIGFSDHTIGDEFAIAATALGARVIEKHFTLDSSKIGMDNNMATEPEKMKELIKKCNLIFEGLGKKKRKLSRPENHQRKLMRRSIVAKKNIFKGEKITIANIDYKRPGNGIPINLTKKIIGKIAKRNINKEQLIFKRDLKFN